MGALLYDALPLLLLLCTALTVLYFLFYLRAMAPKKGTLEWIALYDRPALRPARLQRLHWWEFLCALGLCLIPLGFYIPGLGLNLGFDALRNPELWSLALPSSGLFALSALAAFVLARIVTGSAVVSLVSALIPGLCFFSDAMSLALLELCMIPLALFLRTDPERPAPAGFLALGLFSAGSALSLIAGRQLHLPLALLWLALLGALLWRFHETHRPDRLGQLLFNLGFGILVFLTASILGRIAALGMAAGNLEGLRESGFWTRALLPWRPLPLLPPVRLLLTSLPGLIPFCLAAAGVSIYTGWRYGHGEVLLLPMAAVAAVLTGLALTADLIPAGAALALACCSARLLERHHRLLAWLGLSLCLALTILMSLGRLL